MKIHSAKTVSIRKWVEVHIEHNKIPFMVSVQTENGKVFGNQRSGLYTSRIKYLNETPTKVKEKHFKEIKAYVEKYIK